MPLPLVIWYSVSINVERKVVNSSSESRIASEKSLNSVSFV